MREIIKYLGPLLRHYRYQMIGLLILGSMISGLRGLTPELSRRLIDLWREGDGSGNISFPIGIAAIWFISSIFRYIHSYKIRVISEKIMGFLRMNLMRKYLDFDLKFMHSLDTGSGGLISRISNEILHVQFGIQKMTDMMKEPFAALFMFGYLLMIDWKLTIFIVATLPIVGVLLKNIAKSIRKYITKNFTDMENISKTLKESLDGSRIVKSYNLQGVLEKRFNSEVQQYIDNRKVVVSREEATGPIIESIGALGFSALLVYIGNQIIAGQLTVADFMGFSFAVAILQDAVKRIQQAYVAIQQAVVSLQRYHEMLGEENHVKDTDSPIPFPNNWKSIEFKNVTFSYIEGKPVLKNFNLSVKRGESIALVGSSGSGKSTTVNLLQRFYDPDSGQILVDGIDIKRFSLEDLRKNIAMVSQDVFLFNDSVEFNIRAGNLEDESSSVEEAATLANAHNFISAKENAYNTRVGEAGSQFSGGEKQRISIARAIFKNAPILVLDEATSALDSESEREVQKGISQLMKGKTSFVIAHRLSTVQDADRIIVMKFGEIIEAGNHDELMQKQGEYHQLRELQH
ncbi:MAG: ABC transporter ATP-binding protein [Bdellovibrionota bacterium]|nr:ABC transporter ATP-binding protein [Bdellovibrionota bacterium]